MTDTLIYDPKHCQGFEQEWRAHHNCTELWVCQGIFNEALLPESMYAYRASVRIMHLGARMLCAADFALSDLLHAKSFEYHAKSGKDKPGRDWLYLDQDSLLVGEALQVLYEKDALALRLRDPAFGLDLRLDRAEPPYWCGGGEALSLGDRGKTLFAGVLPHMPAVGRLYFADYSMRVQGRSAFERVWGRFSLLQAAQNWERFYLFLNNGDEMVICQYPFANTGWAWCLPEHKPGFSLKNYKMTAVDFLEIDEWRFASGWRLEAPEYRSAAYYLIPLISDQFCLPVSRPALGVFDADGNRLGYALSELYPGARNELKRLPVSLYEQDLGPGFRQAVTLPAVLPVGEGEIKE